MQYQQRPNNLAPTVHVPAVQSPAPLQTPRSVELLVQQYSSVADMQRRAQDLAGYGYHIVSTVSQNRGPGCLAIATLGLWALLFPKKPLLIVTYQR